MKLFKKYKSGYRYIFIKIIIAFFLLSFAFIIAYGLMTILGGIIPVNQNRSIPLEGVEFYLINNGYHIALVLPRDNCPYREIFDPPLNLSGKGGYYYFGWGDRQFYLGTPTVRNIDWSMAMKALFIPSSSVLEVLYIRKILSDQPGVTSLVVTEEELSNLYQYVKETIMDPQRIPEQISPDEIDQVFQGSIFFEARGFYSLFNTCNNWTSRALNMAGLKTHLWTPLTWGVK